MQFAAAIAFAPSLRLLRPQMTGSSRSHFSLQDRSISLDERVHAVRGDLADLALAGQIFVPHYARPMPMTCAVGSVLVRKDGKDDAEASTQLLLGEDFMVLDLSGGWAWGYCKHDHYVGFVPQAALSDVPTGTGSAMIAVRDAILFAEADANSAQTGSLPIGCVVRGPQNGDFLQTPLGYVHLDAVDGQFKDRASVAELLIDTPYVWGGRTSSGIDCSGLIQLACAFAGENVPRDTDQQESVMGIDLANDAALQRDDVIFFPGHVGIMANSTQIIHATQHHGKTVIEDLAVVTARYAAEHDGRGITARKRLS